MGIGVSKSKGGNNGSKLLRTISRLIPKRNKNKNEQSKQRKPSNFENKVKGSACISNVDKEKNVVKIVAPIDERESVMLYGSIDDFFISCYLILNAPLFSQRKFSGLFKLPNTNFMVSRN